MDRILVVEDDPHMGSLIKEILSSEGYTSMIAGSGAEALEQAIVHVPDLIVLDRILPDMDGLEVCRKIREIPRISHIPILVISARGEVQSRVEGLRIGVDDYMPKPFDVTELVARIQSHIRRATEERSINALSGLPGNLRIYGYIDRKLTEGAKIAVLYLDLDNFKAYNDHYGFAHGDDVILLVASIIEETVADAGRENQDLVGHIGGDDFVVVTEPGLAEGYCRSIIDRFDTKIPLLYEESDRERGRIEVRNRRGETVTYPIMTVSIGVVGNDVRDFESHAELAEVAAEVKNKAKSEEGSHYYCDRRTSK